VAVAWELLHIGLLLHDDVIDRDYSRHGQPNVAGQYLKIYDVIDDEARRSHLAQSASLLAGDLLLATARQQLADVALTNIFDNALFEVIGGELMDMETSLPDSTISPEAIAASKTASYTFIGPLLSGATMAGADVKQLQLLGELGRVLGLGFQLADDLLVFSDDSSTGKSNDSDLVEGKRTAVISMALTLLSPQDRTRALELLNSPSPEPDELRRLITSTNVQSVLADRLEGYGQQARAIVEQLKIMPEYKLQFEALIGKLFDGQT
jgi:geranylgeranyl diphosphate synthase type II